MFKIDRDTHVPLYMQLAQNMEESIRSGRFQPGAKIPSETELMKQYSVSRITVRQAMSYLSDKDLIVRRRGLGSFVRRTDIKQPVETLFGVYQSLSNIVPDMTMKLLEYSEIHPTPEVRSRLQTPNGETVLKFIRLFQRQKEVLLAADVFIPIDIARHWNQDEAEKKHSLCLLEENAGQKIARMEVGIRAVKASEAMAAHLQVPLDSPLLELRRLALSDSGRPLQYAVVVFQGESYELTTQITVDRFSEKLKIGKYTPST